jgi:hypothetical protein
LFTRESKFLIPWSLGLVAFLSFLSQFLAFRPIQDDYFILGALSEQPIRSIIQNVWASQGGNLLPYVVNSLLLASSLNSLDFVASRVFLLTTVAVVIFVSLVFLKWFGLKNKHFKLTYIAISLLAFEGIFTPLQIAAYSWHQASITHLWPVALTILIWKYPYANKVSGLVMLLAGLVVGNSNSAEALWSIIVTCLFLMTFLPPCDVESKRKRIQLKIFIASSSLGLAVTVAAPGFWNRANNSVGMPNSFQEVFYRLGKSVGAFSFDLLTHPIIWLAFTFGIICRREFDEFELLKIPLIATFLTKSSVLLYALLIIGTTIGYPSWHQSLGLYVVFVPSIFLAGLLYKNNLVKCRIRVLKSLFLLSLITCLGFSLRSSTLVITRAQNWDAAYQSNVCSIKQGITDDLIGAELIYPLFNKGIEDVNRWLWMRKPYIQWITSQNSSILDSCSD